MEVFQLYSNYLEISCLLSRLSVATGPTPTRILYATCFDLKLSGDEVYHTFLILIKIMLCSKLHCQKVLN